MATMSADGGLFRPGDEVGRAWDEAEAVLLACEDLESVMATIRDAGSPVQARRALKTDFGFTGRQAAVLLTLPVLSFTRSERDRLDESRRSRMDLLADVTGAIPAIPATRETGAEAEGEYAVGVVPAPEAAAEQLPEPAAPRPIPASTPAPTPKGQADWNVWGSEFDGTLGRIQSVMDEHYGVAPSEATGHTEATGQTVVAGGPGLAAATAASGPAPVSTPSAASSRSGRRSVRAEPEDAAEVLDEQIGELCTAIAELLQVAPPASPWLDDPREATSPTGQLLGSCGLDDATGVRTLLWHLRRTGLESVEALLPFAEPLPGDRGFDIQSVQFEAAMVSGGLGSEPGGDASWTGRLWPIADRRGFGYAVHYRPGPGTGAVWAYGGGEPLHLLWDSVVDMLVELYQSLIAGEAVDGALGTVVDGRVLWTNLA